MTTTKFHRTVWAIVITLLALVIFGGTGFFVGKQFAGHRNGPPSSKSEEDTADNDLKNPMIRDLAESIGEANDIESEDRLEARRILREADEILTRIKQENREGIRRANNPPKRRQPAPKKETLPQE